MSATTMPVQNGTYGAVNGENSTNQSAAATNTEAKIFNLKFILKLSNVRQLNNKSNAEEQPEHKLKLALTLVKVCNGHIGVLRSF